MTNPFANAKRVPKRRRRGSTPDDSKGALGVVFHQGVTWLLCARGASPCGRYANMKLAADCVLGKANYWVTWDLKRARMTGSRDWLQLRAALPEVHDAVLQLLGGVSAAQLLTGRERCAAVFAEREPRLVPPQPVSGPRLRFVDTLDIFRIFAGSDPRNCENDVADLIGEPADQESTTYAGISYKGGM